MSESTHPVRCAVLGCGCRHVALVEIQGDKFRLLQIPLYTVRPFVIEDLTLSDELQAQDPNILQAVEEVLTQKINDVLEHIKSKHTPHYCLTPPSCCLRFPSPASFPSPCPLPL